MVFNKMLDVSDMKSSGGCTPVLNSSNNLPDTESDKPDRARQTSIESAVFLGMQGDLQILNQTPRGRNRSANRSLVVSPDNETNRPRKISVDEKMRSPRLLSQTVVLMTPRRNSWCPSSKKTSRKTKTANRRMTDQTLITQLFKPSGKKSKQHTWRMDQEKHKEAMTSNMSSYPPVGKLCQSLVCGFFHEVDEKKKLLLLLDVFIL